MDKAVIVFNTDSELELYRARDFLEENGIKCAVGIDSFHDLYGFSGIGGFSKEDTPGHKIEVLEKDKQKADDLLNELFKGREIGGGEN